MSVNSHYDVQKKRRDAFRAEWQQHRQTVVSASDGVAVTSSAPSPGHTSTAYLGSAAGRPTRLLDATRHDFDRGSQTSPCTHSWDAINFVIAGSGTVTVGDRSYPFGPWDAFHFPAFTPYQCDFDTPTRLLTFSSFPAVALLGAARMWSDGVEGPGPPEAPTGAFVPRSLAVELADGPAEPRVHTDYDSEPLRLNPKGTRSKFLVDPSLGYRTSGLTMVMTQYAPGRGQAMHAHPGEAYLYVVEGEGESYIGPEPEGGTWYPWQAGDFVVVDHFVWHQHRNRSHERPARLLRVHMMETMLATMQALLDPIELLLEPEEIFRRLPDVSGVEWPPDTRPAAGPPGTT